MANDWTQRIQVRNTDNANTATDNFTLMKYETAHTPPLLWHTRPNDDTDALFNAMFDSQDQGAGTPTYDWFEWRVQNSDTLGTITTVKSYATPGVTDDPGYTGDPRLDLRADTNADGVKDTSLTVAVWTDALGWHVPLDGSGNPVDLDPSVNSLFDAVGQMASPYTAIDFCFII